MSCKYNYLYHRRLPHRSSPDMGLRTVFTVQMPIDERPFQNCYRDGPDTSFLKITAKYRLHHKSPQNRLQKNHEKLKQNKECKATEFLTICAERITLNAIYRRMINRYHKYLAHRNWMSQRIKDLPTQRGAFCASLHWSTELPGKICSSKSRSQSLGEE
ncbi:UNVERIFIED_CONTAM: hypothetical protein NCL1_24205 [Trichonephila clavipes]